MANTSDEETRPLLSDVATNAIVEPEIEAELLLGNPKAIISREKTRDIPEKLSTHSAVSSIEVEVNDGDGHYITQSYSSLQNSSVTTPPHQRTSNLASLMHLLKGNIGTGILAMPSACKYAGLWAGPAGILIIGFIATHCMHVLVNCSRRLCKRSRLPGSLDYASILEQSLKTGPVRLQRFSKAGNILGCYLLVAVGPEAGLTRCCLRKTINGFLILTQFGFCCVYILFVAQNIKSVIHAFHPDDPDVKIYLLVIAALLIPYCFVKNLKALAPFSTFANVLIIVGIIIVFQYTVQGLPDVSTRPAVMPVDKLPLYFGTAMFAFEAIGLVMPIENKMKHPEDFGGFAGVLNLGMTFVVCLYTAMGFYGFLKFGSDAKGSVTLNLPSREWLYMMANVMYAISVFISFGLQLYVVIKILWPIIEKRTSSRRGKIFGEYIFRTCLVLAACGFAMVVPHLDLMISLVGALASSSLALIFPPLIEIITFSAEGERLSKIVFVKNVLIMTLGVVGFATGTVSALREIIETFETSNPETTVTPWTNITTYP